MRNRNKTKSISASLGLILEEGHRLNLDDKSKIELEDMKRGLESSLYARFCNFFGVHYSQRYLARIEAIKGSMDYLDMIEFRKKGDDSHQKP